MKLCSPIEHGRDKRNANAAADVARQVHQAGRRVVLLPRQVCVRRSVDRNKEKRQTRSLKHTRKYRRPEINLKVKSRHVKQRCGQDRKPQNHEPSRIEA